MNFQMIVIISLGVLLTLLLVILIDSIFLKSRHQPEEAKNSQVSPTKIKSALSNSNSKDLNKKSLEESRSADFNENVRLAKRFSRASSRRSVR